MKRLFSRNRWLSSTLNIIGLTVAFTAFMVIMIQVRYDWRYDRNYPGHEKVFRLEFVNDPSNLGAYGITICRPFIESLKGTIPQVEELGVYRYWKNSSSEWYRQGDEQQEYTLESSVLDTCMLKVFPFEFTEGDPAEFARPGSIIIAESVADRLFPGESPAGETLIDKYSGAEYRIAAVYKDFPENSSVANGALIQVGNDDRNNTSEWSYNCYMKLADHIYFRQFVLTDNRENIEFSHFLISVQ